MGPCTANARRPTVESRCRGTVISCCVADLSRCLPTTSVTGVQQSTRYRGALPCQHLCMMTPSLYVTRSATSSQCRSSCKILVRPDYAFSELETIFHFMGYKVYFLVLIPLHYMMLYSYCSSIHGSVGCSVCPAVHPFVLTNAA